MRAARSARICKRRAPPAFAPVILFGKALHLILRSPSLFELLFFAFGVNPFQSALLFSSRSLRRGYHMILHPKRMTALSLPIAQLQPRGEAPDVDILGNILLRSSEMLVECADPLCDLPRLLHRQQQTRYAEQPG